MSNESVTKTPVSLKVQKISGLKRNVTIALLGALAVLTMKFLGVPIIPFASYLKYEPSGVFLLIAGYFFGPAGAFITCLLKEVLVFFMGGGNIYGIVSDFLASASMACIVAAIGYGQGTKKRWIAGCVAGTIVSTLLMIPANYVILYFEFGMPASAVTASMVGIIPFNLLKGILNALLFLLLQKPLKRAFQEVMRG